MGQTNKQPRTRLLRIILSIAVPLCIACGLLYLFLSRKHEEHLRPTVTGWRASVETLAGDGSPGVQDSGAAREARFGEPFGVAVGRDGSLYIADAGRSNRIRKVSTQGAVTTLAGGGEGDADGAGATAAFDTPSGLAIDDAGNLYVADTGNNRIRKVTPEGAVTTLAGDGTSGYRDGAAQVAQFNAPIGVAVDRDGNIFVADTYNDRIRLISKDGQVKTVAGAGTPGLLDGEASAALFDTPCAVAANGAGELFIADTGNNRLRKLTKDGQVITLPLNTPGGVSPEEISRPTGLALTHDGFIYVTELDRGRVRQIAPDGTVRHVAGLGSGFADGVGLEAARFNQPAGVAVARDGSLLVADSANYLVRRVFPAEQATDIPPPPHQDALPRLQPESMSADSFPWPLDPQRQRHELVATLGEVRGSYETEDSRHHLHSGIDVFGLYGQTVRAVFEEKVSSPLGNWGFGSLNEGLRAGLFSYIHLRVGRNERDEMLPLTPFIPVRDETGKIVRVRVRRGTHLRAGESLGTINRMYHVHLNLGPPGAEFNPLALPFEGFSDRVAPVIERDGIQLFDETGQRVKEKSAGRLVVRGAVRIVVDAYDRVDGNQSRRRLGLYKLGYQVLLPDKTPAHNFEQPRSQIEFDRLPPSTEATKIAYADQSGITVYGSASTRFLYEVTNIVRGGRAQEGRWETSELPAGDYILRIFAADYAGNEATTGRDVAITIRR